MNKTDNLYEVSKIKNQFEKLQKKYQTQLPNVDPYLVYDLLLRQQKNPETICMYNIEVFTKQGIDTNAAKEHIYKKTDMVPAVYDKGTHYVTNQKLTLEILKEISDCEEVLQVSGEYTGCCCSESKGTSHEPRNQRNSSKHSFYGWEDMFLDNNKTIAVEQEEEKNIKHQKIRRIDFWFKREVFFIVAGVLMGAIVMAIPMTFLYTGIGSGYYLTWIVFGHIVGGVHSSISSTIIIAGITTAVVILIIVFLIKWNSSLEREVKRRTKELDKSNKQLVLANKKLESANEQLKIHDNMQNEFINIAAHELRTPIQPILGLSQVIQSKIKDAELGELQGVVIRNAKRLQRLVDDILDVTRIESNSLNLKKEQFDINKKILNVIKDTEKHISDSNKLKILFVEPNEAILVDADKVRIYQVIINLLNNAIKFTKEAGTITILVQKKDNDVLVSVKDSGVGIDPEILPMLFSKFASKSYQGTELGLFVSKSIIEAHGGRIWAGNNADGKGSTFSFTLPV